MTDNITKLLDDALVLDTETTSLDFKEAEVIEYASASSMAIVQAVADDDYNSVGGCLFKPSSPILPEVSAITNISNRMVEHAQLFETALERIQNELNQYEYYVAHNAFYDEQVLKRYQLKLPKQICTMRLAKKLYADDDKVTAFNLPYLRYALDVPVSDDMIAHRAAADVIVTGMLFALLVEKAIEDEKIDPTAENLGDELIAWLDEPIIITKMPFGKHKGKKLTEVPLDYWMWALENMDSLQEDKPEFDKDFAASVTNAVEEIFASKG